MAGQEVVTPGIGQAVLTIAVDIILLLQEHIRSINKKAGIETGFLKY